MHKHIAFVLVSILFAGIGFAQPPPLQPAPQPEMSGWVVLPVKEYEALRTKASPPVGPAASAPAEATLTRIDYELTVKGSVASGQATLTVDVLKQGWVTLPIPQGLLVRDASMGGERLALLNKPGRARQLSAVLAQPGRTTIFLDVAFTVASGGAEERLTIPVGKSGVTRAVLNMAGRDVEVTVAGGYLAERAPARWLAYAKGNTPLTFSWRKRIDEQPQQQVETRTRGTLVQLFALGEDNSTLTAEVEFEVIQGSAQQVQLTVPPNVTINQVPGANVGDWRVENGALSVMFLEPVEKTARFAISAEASLPREGPIPVPLLRLVNVERESGGVAVEVMGAGEIKDSRAQGFDPAEASSLGQTVAARQSPSLVSFRSRPVSTAATLEVNVARYNQQAVFTANIDEARYRVLLTVDGKTLIQARYAVRNNQRNFLSVRLPQGALLWSAVLAGQPVRPGETPDGALLVPLAKGRAGDDAPPFGVEIMYSLDGMPWQKKGEATLVLPLLDLPVSRSGLVLYVPPAYRVTPLPGAFRLQSYEPPISGVLSGTATVAPVAAPTGAALTDRQQAMVDRFVNDNAARKDSERLPVRVTFPTMGASGFLASELTAEKTAGVIQLTYQEDKKGGVR